MTGFDRVEILATAGGARAAGTDSCAIAGADVGAAQRAWAVFTDHPGLTGWAGAVPVEALRHFVGRESNEDRSIPGDPSEDGLTPAHRRRQGVEWPRRPFPAPVPPPLSMEMVMSGSGVPMWLRALVGEAMRTLPGSPSSTAPSPRPYLRRAAYALLDSIRPMRRAIGETEWVIDPAEPLTGRYPWLWDAVPEVAGDPASPPITTVTEHLAPLRRVLGAVGHAADLVDYAGTADYVVDGAERPRIVRIVTLDGVAFDDSAWMVARSGGPMPSEPDGPGESGVRASLRRALRCSIMYAVWPDCHDGVPEPPGYFPYDQVHHSALVRIVAERMAAAYWHEAGDLARMERFACGRTTLERGESRTDLAPRACRSHRCRQCARRKAAANYRDLLGQLRADEAQGDAWWVLTVTLDQRAMQDQCGFGDDDALRAVAWMGVQCRVLALLTRLRTTYPDLAYRWVLEPHASGWPHAHIILRSGALDAAAVAEAGCASMADLAATSPFPVDGVIESPPTECRFPKLIAIFESVAKESGLGRKLRLEPAHEREKDDWRERLAQYLTKVCFAGENTKAARRGGRDVQLIRGIRLWDSSRGRRSFFDAERRTERAARRGPKRSTQPSTPVAAGEGLPPPPSRLPDDPGSPLPRSRPGEDDPRQSPTTNANAIWKVHD